MVKSCLKNSSYLFSLLLLAIITACGDDDKGGSTTPPDPVEPTITLDANKEFVWKAMNSWYYFQRNVSKLDDSKDDNTASFNTFLNGYSSAQALFDDVKYLPESVDKYSYMVEDYNDLGSSLNSEYNKFGHEFTLIRISGSENVVGFIRFVFPNSAAENAGLERGLFFTEINDQRLTINNYRELLDQDSYTMKMAKLVQENNQNVLQATGQVISVQRTDFELSPIWVTKVIDFGGKKVGYLCFSNFASDFHSQLNAVFANFKSQNIDELVLDLRYNPGGSVLTAQYLASMIYSTNTSKLLAKLDYNDKHNQFDSNLFFTNQVEVKDQDFQTTSTETLNSVGLNKLYVITSSSTASASEFIINGLRPYIPVTLIGGKTEGKNLGSISLYNTPNSDYTNKPTTDIPVKIGLQPIVSKIFNSRNESNYSDGFTPDIESTEPLHFADVKPLGDPDEKLLNLALREICPTCRIAPSQTYSPIDYVVIGESSEFQPNYQITDVRLK